MRNKSTLIALLLLLLLLVPVIVILLYEFNSSDANEQYLQEGYRRQLATVIYAVNQSSLESASTWGRELENIGQYKNRRTIPRFCQLYSAIRAVLLTDSLVNNPSVLYCSTPSCDDINRVPESLRQKARRLIGYQRAGYQKMEAEMASENDSLMYFACAITPENEPARLAFIVLNRQDYISQILRPQIVRVAGSLFHITIFTRPGTDSTAAPRVFFSTSPGQSASFENADWLWLLPHCKIGVKLRTGDVSEFVSKRTRTSIYLFSALLIFISLGAFFMIRSVRKELQVAQMKSDFVANISHEFRTPLSLISMFAETLELGRVRTEEKKMEYYGVIYSEAQRLSKLVNAILNFSHIESGQRHYQMKEFILQDLLQDISHAYRYHAQQKGFAFRLEMPEAPQLLTADYEALTEAVINLIDNGMKYSADKKEITLRCGVEGTMVFIAVSDKGIGFAPEERKRIFEKFYRVPTGNVHNVKGSGIGLSIVKHVVDAHEGKIEVESSPGEGSTFRLLLPKPL